VLGRGRGAGVGRGSGRILNSLLAAGTGPGDEATSGELR
jgi:hypothetical protein